MAGFSESIVIQAPIERVFDVFTDLARAGERLTAVQRIEVLTDGPVGKGTRWRETRLMMKSQVTETLEFTAFERPGRCVISCVSREAAFETEFRFLPDGAATRVEMQFNWKPQSLMAKLMSPLAPLIMRMIRKSMVQDLNELKTVAEHGDA